LCFCGVHMDRQRRFTAAGSFPKRRLDAQHLREDYHHSKQTGMRAPAFAKVRQIGFPCGRMGRDISCTAAWRCCKGGIPWRTGHRSIIARIARGENMRNGSPTRFWQDCGNGTPGGVRGGRLTRRRWRSRRINGQGKPGHPSFILFDKSISDPLQGERRLGIEETNVIVGRNKSAGIRAADDLLFCPSTPLLPIVKFCGYDYAGLRY